jgi:hypothetical protein
MAIKTSLSLLDGSHLALMLSALVLSYILPFELIIFSYAILGPAHYLTEISWLHERSYFLPHRLFAITLIVATVLMVAFRGNFPINSFLLVFLLGLCVALAFTEDWRSRTIITGIGALLALLSASYGTPAFILTILIPSLIHVSLFTLIFILVGYLNSGGQFQLILAFVYILSIALILSYPPPPNVFGEISNLTPRFFGGLSEAIADLIGSENVPVDSRLAGLLSFVYTYHYLNWFIKVRLINWHRMSKRRLVLIVLMYLASIGLYLYDYGLGLTLLFSLSLLHVVLEFPLNAISFRQLVSRRVTTIHS